MELSLALPYTLGLVAAFNPCGFALLPAYLAYFLGLELAESADSAPAVAAETAVVGTGASDVGSGKTDDAFPGSGAPAAPAGLSTGGTVSGSTATEGAAALPSAACLHGGTALLAVAVRGIVVGLTLTAGFVSVFGACGLLFSTVLSQRVVLDRVGYVTIAIGAGMVVLGAVMLSGRYVTLPLPRMGHSAGRRGLASIFTFGVGYAVVSLSCTIGIFIAGVSNVFTGQGFVDGVANFVAYGAGMGSVVTFLTLSLALARSSVVDVMRRALRWVNPFTGLVLAAAGVYVASYGWWELQLLTDHEARNPFVSWFLGIQADIANWISHATPQRLGVVCLFGVTGALLLGRWQQQVGVLNRWIATAAYAVAWLLVEFGFNEGDFVLGPLLRFIAGWPGRMMGWLSDPLRLGVIGEVAFIALALWAGFRCAMLVFARIAARERTSACG